MSQHDDTRASGLTQAAAWMELHYLGYDDASIATAFIAARRAPGPDAALLAIPSGARQGRHVLSRAAYRPDDGGDAWSVTPLSTLTDKWGHGLHELHCGERGERDDRCGPNGELCDCPCHLGLPVAMAPRPVLSPLTLDAIAAEATRAHLRHGEHSMLGPHYTSGDRLAILVEEVGEVAHELTYDQGDPGVGEGRKDELVKELIQVAAMAATWIEYLEGGPR
jgi:hypothetical protein